MVEGIILIGDNTHAHYGNPGISPKLTWPIKKPVIVLIGLLVD